MRVAIDLRPLQVGHENRGIGNYLLNILSYFPDKNTRYIFVRYSKSNPIKDYSISLGNNKYEEVIINRHEFSKNPKKLLWFLLGLFDPVFLKVKLHRPNIYFQPDYLFGIPRGLGINTVVVMYDIIPFLFRSMYLPNWRKYTHYKQLRLRSRTLMAIRAFYYERRYQKGISSLRRAKKIISISKTTTSDLKRVFNIKPNKIKTIHLAPSFISSVESQQRHEVDKRRSYKDKRYLLFIGGTDIRRQVHELIFAFNILNSWGYEFDLILAGNEFTVNSDKLNTKVKKAIEKSSYRHMIHLLGKIDEIEKTDLYKNAFAFVYPTIYEGFGLPILEAATSGCPVITYDNPATKEIAGDAAIYVSTQDGIGIYNEVVKLVGDELNRSKIVKRGLKLSNKYSWDKTGKETIQYIFD